MSPGTTLAQARRRAGLSVTEVSQQTRIRESIIRGIEQDDYSACGGDFYARGHIRALARAIGTDPGPLIEEYDAVLGGPIGIDAILGVSHEPRPQQQSLGNETAGSTTHNTLSTQGSFGTPETPAVPGPPHQDPPTGPARSWPSYLGPPADADGFLPLPSDLGAPGDTAATPGLPSDLGAPGDTAASLGLPSGFAAPGDAGATRGQPGNRDSPPGTGTIWPGSGGPAPRHETPATYQPGDFDAADDTDEFDRLPSDLDAPGGTVPTPRLLSEPGTAGDTETFRHRAGDLGPPHDSGTTRRQPREPGLGPEAPRGLDILFGGRSADRSATDRRGRYRPTREYPASGEQPARRGRGSGQRTQPLPTSQPPRNHPAAGGPGAGAVPLIRDDVRGGPRAPTRPPGSRPTGPADRQRRANRAAIVLVALLAVVGVVCYLLVSGSGRTPRSAPAAGPGPHPKGGHGPSRAAPAPSHSAASPPPSQTLHPASASAYGPGGTGDGDNPQNASLAIDGSLGTDWKSDWYSTSLFGNLKNGTGLLLDMGRRVTITGVRIAMASYRGAGLELRTGSSTTYADMHTVARASSTGGLVRPHLYHPAKARYLLIWFTTLPPDGNGTYRATVYNVTVMGHT